METLEIKLSQWLTGKNIISKNGVPESALYRIEDKKKCCLGFYGLKRGLKVADIAGKRHPGFTANAAVWPAWLYDRDRLTITDECTLLMNVNDATHYRPNPNGIIKASDFVGVNFSLWFQISNTSFKKLPMSKRKSFIKKIFARNGVKVEFVK